MPNVTRSALVPYSAAQLYRLVADVNSYDQFIPGCSAASLHGQANPYKGSMELGLSGFNYTLSTDVTLEPEQRITTVLTEGPFKKLVGVWRFTVLSDQACKVEFDMKYELGLRALALKPFVSELANSMVSSFVDRAKEVYG